VIATVYLGVLGLVILVVTGSAASVSGWQSLMTFLGAGLGTAYVGLGVAEVTSCLFLYPVASIDRPFSSPQGRALAQGFMPFLYMLIMLVMLAPTAVVAIMSLVVGFPGWIAGLVGLANGLLVLAVGVWLGGRVMDRRLPSIVATLQSLASLQK
jgi:ABC-2 type transport system permease protein